MRPVGCLGCQRFFMGRFTDGTTVFARRFGVIGGFSWLIGREKDAGSSVGRKCSRFFFRGDDVVPG